jgi:hypothetical protein
MKITAIRHFKMSVVPHTKVNDHIVSVNDMDVGEVIKRIKVPTGITNLYVLIYLEIQTSGSLRNGERFELGNVEFEVIGMKDGCYMVSTEERLMKKIEIWTTGMEIRLKDVRCQ